MIANKYNFFKNIITIFAEQHAINVFGQNIRKSIKKAQI